LGEHVMVVMRMSGRGVGSRVPVAQEFAAVWSFQEQKVILAKSFPSRAEALEAVRE
jgi:hypothetical protein